MWSKAQSDDMGRDTQRAREQTQRALEAEPGNAMALAVEGYIQCQLMGNPEQARKLSEFGHRGQSERAHGLAVQESLFRHVGLQLGIGDRGVYRALPLAG